MVKNSSPYISPRHWAISLEKPSLSYPRSPRRTMISSAVTSFLKFAAIARVPRRSGQYPVAPTRNIRLTSFPAPSGIGARTSGVGVGDGVGVGVGVGDEDGNPGAVGELLPPPHATQNVTNSRMPMLFGFKGLPPFSPHAQAGCLHGNGSCVRVTAIRGVSNEYGNVHTHMAVSPRMGKWLYPCPKQSLKNGYGGYFPSQRVLSSSWTQRAHVPTESAVLSGGWQHTRRAGEMLLNHAQPSQKHIALKRRSGSKKRLLPYGRKQRSARSKSTGSSSGRAPPSTSVRSERFSRKRGWCESTG